MLVACAAGGCHREPATPEPAAAAPPAAAATPKPDLRVFVTNEASGDLTVIDAATQTAIVTAPLGKRLVTYFSPSRAGRLP